MWPRNRTHGRLAKVDKLLKDSEDAYALLANSSVRDGVAGHPSGEDVLGRAEIARAARRKVGRDRNTLNSALMGAQVDCFGRYGRELDTQAAILQEDAENAARDVLTSSEEVRQTYDQQQRARQRQLQEEREAKEKKAQEARDREEEQRRRPGRAVSTDEQYGGPHREPVRETTEYNFRSTYPGYDNSEAQDEDEDEDEDKAGPSVAYPPGPYNQSRRR